MIDGKFYKKLRNAVVKESQTGNMKPHEIIGVMTYLISSMIVFFAPKGSEDIAARHVSEQIVSTVKEIVDAKTSLENAK